MGHFNEILSGRFNRFVQKHFSMKGREGAPTLAADIGMTMAFNSGIENRYLEGWDVFGVALASAGFAANSNTVSIRNPPLSGVVAVITLLAGSEATTDTFLANFFPPGAAGALVDQGTVLTPRAWDARGRPGSSCRISTNSGSAVVAQAGGTNFLNMSFPATNGVSVIPSFATSMEFPLLPGSAVNVLTSAVNIGVNWSCWWRERALEASELF